MGYTPGCYNFNDNKISNLNYYYLNSSLCLIDLSHFTC